MNDSTIKEIANQLGVAVNTVVPQYAMSQSIKLCALIIIMLIVIIVSIIVMKHNWQNFKNDYGDGRLIFIGAAVVTCFAVPLLVFSIASLIAWIVSPIGMTLGALTS